MRCVGKTSQLGCTSCQKPHPDPSAYKVKRVALCRRPFCELLNMNVNSFLIEVEDMNALGKQIGCKPCQTDSRCPMHLWRPKTTNLWRPKTRPSVQSEHITPCLPFAGRVRVHHIVSTLLQLKWRSSLLESHGPMSQNYPFFAWSIVSH